MQKNNTMDNLQQYFKSNKDSIGVSDESIPEGDGTRFEARWEAFSRDRIRFRSSLKRRKKPLWKVVAFPVLASLALIFGVRFLMNPYINDDIPQPDNGMLAVSDTLSPVEVYNIYYDLTQQVKDEIYTLAESLEKEDPTQIYMTVDVITREAVPIIEQLPDEMSDADKIAVLKEYSMRRINALNRYKSTLMANNNL